MLASRASAQNVERKRPFFQASRALAMGDAYTAHDVGYEAVYYNPAGVARRNKPQLKFIDIEGSTSLASVSFLSAKYSSLGDMKAMIDEVSSNAGKPYSFGLAFLPQFLVKNFSLGVIARHSTETFVDTQTKNLNLYTFNDLGAYAHFGTSFFGGILKFGVGLKAIDRAEINKSYTPAEYQAGTINYANQWREGIGYGLDAGILLTSPTKGLPTLGVAVQDIGTTLIRERRMLFTGTQALPGNPPPMHQKVNVGVAIQSKYARGTKSVFSAEVKDVMHLNEGATADHLHAGFELNVKEVFFLRGGLNQGRYWTAGMGMHVGFTGIEVTTYGENVGFTGTRVDDRKVIVRYVLSF